MVVNRERFIKTRNHHSAISIIGGITMSEYDEQQKQKYNRQSDQRMSDPLDNDNLASAGCSALVFTGLVVGLNYLGSCFPEKEPKAPSIQEAVSELDCSPSELMPGLPKGYQTTTYNEGLLRLLADVDAGTVDFELLKDKSSLYGALNSRPDLSGTPLPTSIGELLYLADTTYSQLGNIPLPLDHRTPRDKIVTNVEALDLANTLYQSKKEDRDRASRYAEYKRRRQR